MDNVAPHCDFGTGVYKAWKRAIDKRVIIHLPMLKSTIIEMDGFMIPETNSQYVTKTSVGNANFEHICRRIEITELSKKIEMAKSQDELNNNWQQLQELKAQQKDKVDE